MPSFDSQRIKLMDTVSVNPPRAIIGDTGIIIKDQSSFYYNQHDNASFSSCLSCSSSNSNGTVKSSGPKHIPFVDILSVRYINENNESLLEAGSSTVTSDEPDVEVVFVRQKGKTLVPTPIILSIDTLGHDDVVQEIWRLSYQGTKPRKSILVLVNPHGGKGKAINSFLTQSKPVLIGAQASVEVRHTQYYQHATDIARTLNIDKYDIIACASGDGVPHEVLNGFYQRSDRAEAFNKITITQLPCGSGNAMSESCHGTNNPSFAALSLLKSSTVNLDLMACTQGDKTYVSFLSQTVGVIADSDIGTEALRWLGPSRFELGVAYKVLSRSRYPCDISVKYAAKSKNELRQHFDEHSTIVSTKDIQITEDTYNLKYDPNGPIPDDWEEIDKDLSENLGIFYTGKMPYIAKDVQFFPAALPNDGTFDLVITDARTSIARMAPTLLSLDQGSHVLQPEVQHSKIIAYRLTPKQQHGYLSVDGESYPFETIQVEILPGAAKTLLRNGTYVETNFY
ncbi:Sphingoid long chain base kinase [Wickerhamomyces ciferrii]|uniref:Sphingoid long chain base kinase n=2 Tax=Wickerhamomyces ciferrii TaxID=1041607 RepID=K0KIN6_WICCF|nr:Sphingoid long chain base kinase [Wickerhamomyces ciferrii]AEX09420.1 sphingoid long-chain base kinase [Wickerhamomyces ciferrii]CCH45080.1 Sphingoid long chain base kinase [Wickerhamomyces ciferrii]